jgi:hypothetical protein
VSVVRPTDPDALALALASVRAARHRSEIVLDEVPAPTRLAPHALALSADIADEEGEEIGSGRFVLLHDPEGQEAWDGQFRVVASPRQARAGDGRRPLTEVGGLAREPWRPMTPASAARRAP